jgi:hypothetical protein
MGLDRELLLILASLRAGGFLLDFVEEVRHSASDTWMNGERGFQCVPDHAPYIHTLLRVT